MNDHKVFFYLLGAGDILVMIRGASSFCAQGCFLTGLGDCMHAENRTGVNSMLDKHFHPHITSEAQSFLS